MRLSSVPTMHRTGIQQSLCAKTRQHLDCKLLCLRLRSAETGCQYGMHINMSASGHLFGSTVAWTGSCQVRCPALTCLFYILGQQCIAGSCWSTLFNAPQFGLKPLRYHAATCFYATSLCLNLVMTESDHITCSHSYTEVCVCRAAANRCTTAARITSALPLSWTHINICTPGSYMMPRPDS